MKWFPLALALLAQLSPLHAAHPGPKRTPQEIEAATKLQVFLDRANFSPGKIDGTYGDFTLKALALYRESQGLPAKQPPAAPAQPKGKLAPPDVSDLDLSSVDPVFISYKITAEDVAAVGELPSAIPAQAKMKRLPYKTVAEAVAEKFHSDLDFLAELNPGKMKKLKAGDELTVPNVEPFDLTAVKEVVAGSDVGAPVNEVDDKDDKGDAEDKGKSANLPPPPTALQVDTKTNMLQVREAGKLIAAYPVTIGKQSTASPIGDWKVRGITKLPTFRWDRAMLNHGERSSDFHVLPPGPNNPVGVMWIALNKKGIGIHGTESPDTIGRSGSHGCVRLANWDVVRLATKLTPGTPVSIH